MNSCENPLLRQPILIIGAPRSGTSFLSRLLAEHSQIAMLVEPRLTWKYGNDKKSDLLKPADARPEVVTHIRKKFAEFVEAEGKDRLAEKTPSNALRVGFLHQVFPDAKFINIIRHGKDSALSIRSFWGKSSVGFSGVDPKRLGQRLKEIELRQMPYYAREFANRALGGVLKRKNAGAFWGPRLPGMPSLVEELDPLEVSCLQWRTCVELACAYGRSLPAEQYLELRLESLDEDTIQGMLEFCGLEVEPAMEQYYQEKFVQSKAFWRRKSIIAVDDWILEKWLRPTLSWLGYDD